MGDEQEIGRALAIIVQEIREAVGRGDWNTVKVRAGQAEALERQRAALRSASGDRQGNPAGRKTVRG